MSTVINKNYNKTFKSLKTKKILVYGTGAIAKRLIHGLLDFDIVGVIDGFRLFGNINGIPIKMWDEIYEGDANVVIIASLPQNYSIIFRRIVDRCIAYDMKIYGEDGTNLIPYYGIPAPNKEINNFFNKCEEELLCKIKDYDAISFDLFDTLIMRKNLESADLFDVVGQRIQKKGIVVSDFKKYRREAEFRSKGGDIYVIYDILQQMLNLSKEETKTILKTEIECEKECIIPRKKMTEIMSLANDMGKKINIITNMYLPSVILDEILREKGIVGYNHIYVSCECKGSGLFEKYLKDIKAKKYLHIGDDGFKDACLDQKYGMDVYSIKSAYEMLKITNFRKLLVYAHTTNEKGMLGLMIAALFNSPFALYGTNGVVRISSLKTFGKVFVAPIVVVYILKLIEVINHMDECKGILFGTRDGYLFKKIFDRLCAGDLIDVPQIPTWYFMTSRKICLRAGMKREENLVLLKNYIDNTKVEEVLTHILGIQGISPYDEKIYGNEINYYKENKDLIFKKSEETRKNYYKYIQKCGINKNERYLFCDLVSHGTVQFGLNQLFERFLYGFYLCKIPETYKELEFYSCYEQGKDSEIADTEYVNLLESIITSDESSVDDMDENGIPIMAKEVRTEQELMTLKSIQEGIEEFLVEYMSGIYIKDGPIAKEFPEMFLKMYKEVYFADECIDIINRKLYEDMHDKFYDIFGS